MEPQTPDPLPALAAAYGIDTEFRDWRGRQRVVSDATLRAVLSALDVDAATDAACRAALDEHARRQAAQPVPPCVVTRAGVATELALPAAPTAVHVHLEGGGSRALPAEPAVVVPADLPTGYHRLTVVVGGSEHSTELIVTPDHLTLPTGLGPAGWGLAIQLYSVRSAGSWGVGDLADLRTLARWSAAEHGADFVLVNPVHAAEVVAPMNPSPYLPTTRRFANPLYLRVEDVPEFAALPAAERDRVEQLGAPLRGVGSPDDLIERDPAWAAKREALEIVFAAGRPAEREAAFAGFRAGSGDELERFATWCALSEQHGADWHEWPAELRDPHAAAVADAAAGERVTFYCWLQWLLDEQLDAAQREAVEAGMALGVVHDVAVGVSADGADAWSWQDVMAGGVTVGAPPDAYSQKGQDWQQPPWRPDKLAELAYAPLRDLFRNALRHSGGLRVDHIIGLFRLWWIPEGLHADAGTYVHYDHDALIGILALEAERAGAVIIGEDLGNVEPWVRDYLRERGLLGTSILWFETDPDTGGPLAPQRWREYCLASVTTHDLPPTTGYLAGDHIRLRDRLGLLTRTVDEELAADEREKSAWRAELARCGLLPAGADADEAEMVRALHRFLALTPARLRCVALTDAVGERRTQNQPGTSEEYPNWRIPLGGPDGTPLLLDTVLRDPQVAAVIDAVRG